MRDFVRFAKLEETVDKFNAVAAKEPELRKRYLAAMETLRVNLPPEDGKQPERVLHRALSPYLQGVPAGPARADGPEDAQARVDEPGCGRGPSCEGYGRGQRRPRAASRCTPVERAVQGWRGRVTRG